MFTKKQEQELMRIGLETLIERYLNGSRIGVQPGTKRGPYKRRTVPWNKGLHNAPGTKWTQARRDKFRATMKAKWEAKKSKSK
jgi:hypothetical protein